MTPISAKLPHSESNKVGAALFGLSLQTAVRLTFVNTVNTADIHITRVSESSEAERLNINTGFGGVFVEEPKRKFCEKWGGNFEKEKNRRGGEFKANYNDVLSLSSAELGRNLHLARITERGKGVMEENGC